MNEVVAGAASGFLMGLVFITVGIFMLLFLAKTPPPLLKYALEQTPMVSLAVPLAALAFAFWGVVGLVMGAMYGVALRVAPGGGMGSPNMAFTLAIVVVGLAAFLPFLIVGRRVVYHLLAMSGGFLAVFGWFLPYFAS